MTTIEYLFRRVVPGAADLLPEKMRSPAAAAMLVAIALQESGARHRRQVGGLARGFWQFEPIGVIGVLRHPASSDHARAALEPLCYDRSLTAYEIHRIMEDNDVLACVFARLLLWTLPDALPSSDHADEGWRQYLAAWRPGKPHPKTWAAHYDTAWTMVNAA